MKNFFAGILFVFCLVLWGMVAEYMLTYNYRCEQSGDFQGMPLWKCQRFLNSMPIIRGAALE